MTAKNAKSLMQYTGLLLFFFFYSMAQISKRWKRLNEHCNNAVNLRAFAYNGANVYRVCMEPEGAVTLGNFSCNLSRNFVATQVARIVA